MSLFGGGSVATAAADEPASTVATYDEVEFPRREMAPEGERAWEPIPGAWPPVEEQVDEFLEELPVEAIEHYLKTMEESEAALPESIRALAFWFRKRRERYIRDRKPGHDAPTVALAVRANELACGWLGEAAASGQGEAALALSLLGAIADALDAPAQRRALDTVAGCLTDGGTRQTVAAALSHNPPVTVTEACQGVGDVLTLPEATAEDFHGVTGLLLGLWETAELAERPAGGAPSVPPLSHAKAVADICERAYVSLSARAGASAEETAGMASLPLSVLAAPSSTLSEQLLAVHITAGLTRGMLERFDGAIEGELPPLQAAIQSALTLADSPPRQSKRAARQAMGRLVRGHVAGALAPVTKLLIEQQFAAAGMAVPRGVPTEEPPLLPQQLSELYLTVLVDDVLRLGWTLELMADAGLGDATATAELQGHVDSEHFAQHPAIAAALGETFVVEPPASARRLAILQQLGQVGTTVYDFALDAGMVALMRQVPPAMETLKATYQSHVAFATAALVMPPLTPEQQAAQAGAFLGLWIDVNAENVPLVARLTGDECAAVVSTRPPCLDVAQCCTKPRARTEHLRVVCAAADRDAGGDLHDASDGSGRQRGLLRWPLQRRRCVLCRGLRHRGRRSARGRGTRSRVV